MVKTIIVKSRGIDTGNVCQRTIELDSNYDGARLSIVAVSVPELPRTEEYTDAITVGGEKFDVPQFVSLQEVATYLNGIQVGGVAMFDAYYDGTEFGIESILLATFDGAWAVAIGLPATLQADAFFYRVVEQRSVDVSHGYQVDIEGCPVHGTDSSTVCVVARGDVIPENSVVLGTCRSFYLSISRITTNGSVVPLQVADDRVWSVTMKLSYNSLLGDEEFT